MAAPARAAEMAQFRYSLRCSGDEGMMMANGRRQRMAEAAQGLRSGMPARHARQVGTQA